MFIFHLKYVPMCQRNKFLQNVYISFEICVNVFQLIQNVNISFKICANLLGGVWRNRMDPYKDPTWIPIWILYGSLCGSYMGPLYVNVFTADPKCEYFI